MYKWFQLYNYDFSSFSVHVKYKWEKKRDWVVPLCWSFQGLKLSWRCPHPLECDGKTSLATASPNRFHGPRDGAQWRRWPPIEHCTGHRKDKELYSGRRSDHALLCSGGRAEGGSQAALLWETTSPISFPPLHTHTAEELHQRHDAPLTVEWKRRIAGRETNTAPGEHPYRPHRLYVYIQCIVTAMTKYLVCKWKAG